MHRQLHQSLRLLCRPQCRRRFYSAHAAALQQRTPDISFSEPVASSSREIDLTDNSPSKEDTTVATPEQTTSSGQKKKKRKPTYDNGDLDKPRLGPNKVDMYLASLRAGGIEPTLDDLLRLKPRYPPPANSPKYAPAHAELVDRLCRTFSKDQLRHFGQQLKLNGFLTGSERKKIEYAEAIIEKKWGWENLKDLEKRRRDRSEVLVKSFPVSASELFLLLGKDGTELLEISMDYNVHISVTPNPLSIQIEGSRGSLKELGVLIADRRKAIIEETVELPTKAPLSPNLLQQVSRIANAYIENLGDEGKARVRIYANDQRRLDGAKRLALRAAVNIDHTSNIPLFAILPPDVDAFSPEIFPQSYALFPFLPQRTLPWTSSSGSTFRSRKVSEWLGDNDGIHSLLSAGIAGDERRLFNENGVALTLGDVVSNVFPDLSDSRIITASTGHVLITAKSEAERSSLLPPFPGHWKYPEFMKWMKEEGAHRIFVPSLPSSIHDAPPAQEKIIHRLTYRQMAKERNDRKTATSFSTKIIHAEVLITEEKSTPPDISRTEQQADAVSVEDVDVVGNLAKAELDELLIEPVVANTLQSGEEGVDAGITAEVEDSETINEDTTTDGNGFPTTTAAEPDPCNAVVEAMADVHAGELPAEFVAEAAGSSEDAPLDDAHINAQADNVYSVDSVDIAGAEVLSNTELELQTTQVDVHGEAVCRKGNEVELLVSLPDRPMDVKLTVMDSVTSLPVDELPELKKYFATLKEYLDNPDSSSKNPEPPLSIKHGNVTYVLESNASVRRSVESFDVALRACPDLDSALEQESNKRLISTVTESVRDLETGQKTVNCEISCDRSSSESWPTFLEDLDGLTSLGYKSVGIARNTRFSLDNKPDYEDNLLD